MKHASSFKSYVVGFALSVLCTMTAYGLVAGDVSGAGPMLSRGSIVAAILCLAALQLGVQLIFFLHLGRESKPRWNLLAFLFMFLVLLIVVLGSLWIMNNLNYHMMSPEDMTNFIIEDEGIKP